MKTINFWSIVLVLGLLVSFSSCLKDSCDREVTYTQYTPVYKTYDEIRSGEVLNESPRQMCEPGKIYFYNNYIFINEGREGVHIIDNSTPESPNNIGFISIPGNEDISIKNGMLYANNYIDLLTIDISNLQNVSLISRTENVFPPLWEDIQNDRVLVHYETEEVTEVMDCDTYGALKRDNNGGFWGCFNCFANDDAIFETAGAGGATPQGGSGGGGTSSGIAGSMARFSIIGDYLYVVDQSTLHLFNLMNPTQPVAGEEIVLGWGIETIFPHEDKLFIGSNSGMFIYDNSNPAAPSFLSEFQHARACDPVFVKDNYAYVTLRDGTQCDGFINQLDLVDITDLTNPFLVESFPLTNPHGLSIKDNTLFVCEGADGLKSFDITDPTILDEHRLDHQKDGHAFDVIALPGQADVLLVVGEDGFLQYNFDNPSDLKLISEIRAENCN
jgi:hypothetical protein